MRLFKNVLNSLYDFLDGRIFKTSITNMFDFFGPCYK